MLIETAIIIVLVFDQVDFSVKKVIRKIDRYSDDIFLDDGVLMILDYLKNH